jgi:hypothetical protein
MENQVPKKINLKLLNQKKHETQDIKIPVIANKKPPVFPKNRPNNPI